MKRMTIEFSDEDELAIRQIMQRYGQQTEAGVIRLALHMLSQAKQIILDTPPASTKNFS